MNTMSFNFLIIFIGFVYKRKKEPRDNQKKNYV